jgi:tripartite-type tricarboxylate transporter receptor subunit TctC
MRLAAGAAALPAVSRFARAQAYPLRPVRILEPFGAGGASDIVARIVGQLLQDQLGQPVIVENRSGAGGNIATEAMIKSAPDGHTLLLAGTYNAINASLYERLNFNFIRDVTPVASIIRFPFVMEVHPSVPAKTVPEFIAYATANPGKLNMASAGVGSGSHVAGELFRMMTGIELLHVPFRGPQVLTGMISGQAHVYFGIINSSIEHIRAGKLRALAVTGAARWPALSEVPTVAESVEGYEASGWLGIVTPKATPVEIIGKLNTGINAGLAEPRVKAALEAGGTVYPASPADFGRLISDETEKWAKVVKFSGAKPD